MTHKNRRRGFTLVEMLVVIAIIVVLVAILFPTFNAARHRSRMVQCQTNLTALTQAMTEYKRQYHRYPQRPEFHEDRQIYTGGFSALYPTYLDSYGDLLCPDDLTIIGREDQARERRYSSYNGRILMADTPSATDGWAFATDTGTGNQKVTYNFHGYDEKGWDRNEPLTPPGDPTPAWLERGWRYYPRLMNIYAPEYTVVTHCTFHRDFYNRASERRDTYVNLGSESDTLLLELWRVEDEDGATMFEKQDQ